MSFNIGYIIAPILGFLLGTIPTAYLLRKASGGGDLRTEGTGNIGAMNLYDVSGSKSLGVFAAIADMAKAALATYLGFVLVGSESYLGAYLAGVAALVAHNFNPFLGRKGGRGLAPAAGMMLIVQPLAIALFLIMYYTVWFIIRKNVHIATMGGIIGMTALMIGAPESLLKLTATVVPFGGRVAISAVLLIMAFIIGMKHYDVLKDFIDAERAKAAAEQD